mgnify:FL=1
MEARKGFATMSSRIEHPLSGGTGKPPLAEQRSSYTAEEADAAKAEIEALVAKGFDSRTAAAMKGQITRKTVGYVSKPRQLLEQMIRENKREHNAWVLDSSTKLAVEVKAWSQNITMQIASGMTIEEICEASDTDVETVKGWLATAEATSPIGVELPATTVLLPLSKLIGMKDWLDESGVAPSKVKIEKHNGAQFERFDFDSEEDATLFRLRFL